MADQYAPLTDDEYNAMAKRIAASNPNMSKEEFEKQIAAGVSQWERLPARARQQISNPFQPPGAKKIESFADFKENVTQNAPALAAMVATEGLVNPTTMGALTKVLPKAGPVIAGSRWLRPIVGGTGATGGALARGDQPMDAVEEGAKTAVIGRYLPAVIQGAMNAPGYIKDKGVQMARGYLKPALDAGRQEAQRMFGRNWQASDANNKIVDRALERGILGADNPEQAVADRMTQVEGELGKVVGDQPSRFNNIMKAVIQRGRTAAQNAPEDIPAAQAAIEARIEAIRTGRLGGKLDFGTARPPAVTDTLSAQPLANAMRGTQASAGKIAPPDPKIIHGLQRIGAQPTGGNITTGVPIVTQEVQGPALATSRLEAPMSGQTPRRFAGSGNTEVMREAPPTSPTGAVIGRNFTPPVAASPTTMPLVASHRPQNVTAKEALDFGRDFGKGTSWEKSPSGLIDWFNRQVESGARTAAKQAAPNARALLGEQGELSSLRRVISQAANREGNKNAFLRLPAMLAALKATNPVAAAGTVGGMAAIDRNTGKIAQTLYNAGRFQPSPETVKGTSDAALAAALMQLLKARSNDKK